MLPLAPPAAGSAPSAAAPVMSACASKNPHWIHAWAPLPSRRAEYFSRMLPSPLVGRADAALYAAHIAQINGLIPHPFFRLYYWLFCAMWTAGQIVALSFAPCTPAEGAASCSAMTPGLAIFIVMFCSTAFATLDWIFRAFLVKHFATAVTAIATKISSEAATEQARAQRDNEAPGPACESPSQPPLRWTGLAYLPSLCSLATYELQIDVTAVQLQPPPLLQEPLSAPAVEASSLPALPRELDVAVV